MMGCVVSCDAISCGKRNRTAGTILDWVILWVTIIICTEFINQSNLSEALISMTLRDVV